MNRKPHGASCSIDDECSDTCIDEICAPESDTGGPCDFGQPNDCIHGDVCHTDGYFCSLMSSGCCQARLRRLIKRDRAPDGAAFACEC